MKPSLVLAAIAVVLSVSAPDAQAQFRRRIARPYRPAVAAPRIVTAVPAYRYVPAPSAAVAYVPAPQPSQTSTPYHGVYGYPANAYYPSYVSYAPYSVPGEVAAGAGYPVPSITYNQPPPGGQPLNVSQSQHAPIPRRIMPHDYANPSYATPRPYYGQGLSPVVYPGSITYGQNTQATLTPSNYYGNSVPIANSVPGSNFTGSPAAQVTGSYYAPTTPVP